MNDPQIYLICILLLLLDLVVAAIRASFMNTRYVRLVALRDQGGVEINKTLDLLNGNAPRLRASFQITQAILRFALAGLLLASFSPWEGNGAYLFTVTGLLILTGLLIWFGEYLIEWRILNNPERWAVRLTSLASLLIAVISPLWFLPLLLSRNSQSDNGNPAVVTEEELKTLVNASEQGGMLEQDERQMIFSVFQFGDTLAREIMVPRIDVLALEAHTPLHQAVDVLLESGFSRVPVYEETVDNIIGLLYAKDLLRVWRQGDKTGSLRDMLRPARFTPEAKKVDDLLEEMQSQRIHQAIVVDEYGGVAGLVTLEDIIEEIFGEIQDEFDEAEEMLYQRISDEEYIFQARIDLDDFNEVMGSHLVKDEAETLGGLIYTRIGRVPKTGEQVEENGLLLTVEQISGRRIRKIRARCLPPPVKDDED